MYRATPITRPVSPLGRLVLTLTSAALVLAAAVLSASPSVAAESGYSTTSATWMFGSAPGSAGGYISCPAGTKAVSTGATSGLSTGYLQAGLNTFDGNGGYHTAWGWDGHSLQATAKCVKASRLSGSTLAGGTIRDNVGGFRQFVRTVNCPVGTVPYGGGAFMSHQGTVTGGLATFASAPQGTGWRYGGAGTVASELNVSSHCLPRAKLGRIRTVSQTVQGPYTSDRTQVSIGARCPAGFFAFAGGATFHKAGTTTPSWNGYLSSSAMSADDRGWFAVGTTFLPATRLTATVSCTDRLG
jgi:hypothetical protein